MTKDGAANQHVRIATDASTTSHGGLQVEYRLVRKRLPYSHQLEIRNHSGRLRGSATTDDSVFADARSAAPLRTG